MSKFKNISDEQLAQFIDGNTTDAESNAILDAVQTKEDLETLALAFSAKQIAEEEALDEMPDFDLSKDKNVRLYPFEPLPMTGFLGNEINGEGENSEDSDNSDNESEK